MGYSIRRELSIPALRSAVPGPFRGQIAGLRLTAVTVSLVHFRAAVVREREAKQALGVLTKAGCSEPIVALCDDLTEEARQALSGENVLVIARRSFGWTEQSYEQIRVDIGSRVKRPKG